MGKRQRLGTSLWPLLKRIGKAALAAVRVLPVRLYALMILLVVVLTGYTAVVYLMRTVFTPAEVPEQFLPRQSSADMNALDADASAANQSTTGDRGHYHLVGRRPAAISQTGCSTSGCHGTFPHAKRKETRAFANFHGTFLTCGMCHDDALQETVPATWVDRSGQRSDTPAILRLERLLEVESGRIKQAPGEAHPTLLDGLRSVLTVTGSDPFLEYLLIQLDTSEPGSPVWRQATVQLQEELPNHVRGEYGAKITALSALADMQGRNDRLREQAERYFSAAADSPERNELNKNIHANVLAKPPACLTCHSGEPARLDFDSLGYSPSRVATLRGTPIARMIQQIREGRPFHLPELLEERK